MALNIKFTPAIFSSFQDDLIFTVLDPVTVADPVTYPNFKYIGDIYIGGVLVARVKKIPDPATGVGVFNIGQIVRSYATTVFNPGSGLVAQILSDGAFTLQITMHFGESYSFTDFLDIVVDSTRFFFNNANNRLNNVVSTIVTKLDLFATNRPLTQGKVLFSSQFFFMPFLPASIASYPVVITPILSDGTSGAPFTTSVTAALAYDFQQLNVSPQALNTLSPGLITPYMQGYTVKVGTLATVTIYIICETQYKTWMLHFLNQYGGFDSYLFTKVNKSTINITKEIFGRLSYAVSNTGNVSFRNANGVYNETDSTYSSQYTEGLELNSDLITDGEYLWLKDLMLSPLVYVEDSGSFYCVQITEDTYEAKKNINDELTNLNINLTFGNQLNQQFR